MRNGFLYSGIRRLFEVIQRGESESSVFSNSLLGKLIATELSCYASCIAPNNNPSVCVIAGFQQQPGLPLNVDYFFIYQALVQLEPDKCVKIAKHFNFFFLNLLICCFYILFPIDVVFIINSNIVDDSEHQTCHKCHW